MPTTQSFAATQPAEQAITTRATTYHKFIPLALHGMKVRVHANDNWKRLSAEVNRIADQSALITPEQEKAKYQELTQKYDGAQIDYDIEDEAELEFEHPQTRSHKFSERWVNGGLNDFASTKAGLPDLRSYYGKTAIAVAGAGAGTGAGIGSGAGPIGAGVGALVGIVGGSIASSRFTDAQKDMKKWINKGSTKGGCRVTATDEFPIASLNSQKQAKIHKI